MCRPAAVGLIIGRAFENHRCPHRQLHRSCVELEPGRVHVLRQVNRPVARVGGIGKVDREDFVVQLQRVVAVAPDVAHPRRFLDDERPHPHRLQTGGNHDPRMARSHHHDFGLVFLEASSPVDLVEPVFSGVLDFDALAAARVDRFRISVQALQGCHQSPCPIFALVGLDRHESHNAVSEAYGRRKGEDDFNNARAAANLPMRGRIASINLEVAHFALGCLLEESFADQRTPFEGPEIPLACEQIAPIRFLRKQSGE